MGQALGRLREQREDTERQSGEVYERSRPDFEDGFYRMAVEFAQSIVTECFGDAEGQYFRSESRFQDPPRDSKFPRYDRTIIYLKQYERRIQDHMDQIKEEMNRLQ
jgi:hypothetical protein